MGAVGGQVLARVALTENSGPWHSCGLQVNYLAAAKAETIAADARLLRKGKEMCFAAVDVATGEGKPIAHISTMVRGRFGSGNCPRAHCQGDDGGSDPGAMAPYIERVPFIGARGIRIEHMMNGRSRLVMPHRDTNADESGGIHEGALLALLDTTGAMAAWAEAGPGPHKASTPAMQAQVLGPPPESDLIGYGHVVQRDQEIFFCQVEISSARDSCLVARGTVIYRILD
jgi:uncharacterized protein (TIGR00369 family)